jgi:23S rRNA pseudouridine2604 synthase
MEEEIQFPMRLNRYLALQKHATRRGADELIKHREVFINGRLAVLGDKVEESDVVEIRHKGEPAALVYFAYNKPKGLSTQDAANDKREVSPSTLKNVFPVGGIDKDAHGLVILTNDGRITERLLSSEYGIEREYKVTVKGQLRPNFKSKMEAGVKIEDRRTQAAKVKMLDEHTFRIVLTEERKHQIKRMCVACFQEVEDIERIRIMNISLDTLRAGSHRKIEGEELDEFLAGLGC